LNNLGGIALHVNKALATALALAATSLGLAGCGTSPSTTATPQTTHGKYTIALINGDNIDPYFLTVWHGAYAQAKKLGIKLIEEAPATFNYQSQAPLINDMIAKHVSAIVLSADGTGNVYNQELALAHKDGIPVIIVDETQADMNNNPNALSFITSSNTALAAQAAKETNSLIHGHGIVGVINTSITVTSLLHRYTGFANYLKMHNPGVTVLPQQIAGDSRSVSASLTTDLIESHPNLSAVYAVDSFNGQGAGTAIRGDGKIGKIKLVAIDAEPQEVSLMKEGVIQALIAQQPYKVGSLAVQYAYDALTGHKNLIQRSVEPPGIVVTPQNLNTPAMQKVVYQTWHP
jgi:ribose transport system substrate-binding protein